MKEKIPLVLSSAQVSLETRLLVGGKAANLARLIRAGERTPPWYVITAQALRFAASKVPELQALQEELARSENDSSSAIITAARIRDKIQRLALPKPLTEEIQRGHEAAFSARAMVAVRSSALDEDSAAASFAGLHDSFLFLSGFNEVLEAVRSVWSSLYSERAIAYRLENQLLSKDLSIGVVVQEMVEAVSSGVLFTVNPSSGGLDEVVISSLYGAGEGLVSRGLAADTFVVSKKGEVRLRDVVPKSTKLVFDRTSGRGLEEQQVLPAAKEQASLSDDQLKELVHRGCSIERLFRKPQDIEFSYDSKGTLFILQSRPVTTVVEYGPAAGNRLIWDNSNIIESYSGVTSPMTFSFIKRAYTIVYHCFAEVMGVSPKIVSENRSTFENMLGLFRGQVYYNLLNWYQLVRLFPGFQLNKQFMESMMGLSEALEFTEEKTQGVFSRYARELPALVLLVVRTLFNFARIRSIVTRFENYFDENYSRWSAVDFDELAPHELMNIYREMEDRLLWNWKAPIINDFYVMVFYGALKKLCACWCADASSSLQNDLLCGEGDIKSTEPTKKLMAIARAARNSEALLKVLQTASPEAAATMVNSEPEFSWFAAEIEEYLQQYGFRCMNELKLEEGSLRDRPEFVYQILKNYALMSNSEILDTAATEARERGIRQEAENKAFSSIAKCNNWFPRAAVFRWVLRNARVGVKNRENMRFARTKIYGVVRELLGSMGKHLAEEGLIDSQEDIFYLTIDEVWDFVKGTAVSANLRSLAALRKAEFAEYRENEEAYPDEHFETYGMAYHRNIFRRAKKENAETGDGDLRGIPCCPGVVSAPVKVIQSPSDDISLNGEILVAGRTDPGWVPLYPSVCGILIERGSILSHSAIVAREMGIPTIVGISGLLERLNTGDRVVMDGATGIVRVEGIS